MKLKVRFNLVTYSPTFFSSRCGQERGRLDQSYVTITNAKYENCNLLRATDVSSHEKHQFLSTARGTQPARNLPVEAVHNL